MLFNGEQLQAATGGTLIQNAIAGSICTDTRKIQKGDWFLALVGERFDAHHFLNKAKEMGCAGVIANYVPKDWDIGFLKVSDTLVALQDIARYARNRYEGTVIAITGSAGKTTTRALVQAVLQEKGRVLATQGNFNNHIGLPLTILGAEGNEDFWVLELGMNHAGEIALLQEIAKPHIRLITNVGAAHLEGLGSIEGVAKAKGELFDGANPSDICLINSDDKHICSLPLPAGVKTLRFGRRTDSIVQLLETDISAKELSTTFRIQTPKGQVLSTIQSPGEHLALNATAAVAVGFLLDVPSEKMSVGMSRYKPVGARLRVEAGPKGIRLLNDAYNANPLSMKASLRTLAQLQPQRRIACLGDMLELGDEEVQEHLEIIQYALSLELDLIGVCGPIFTKAAHLIQDSRFLIADDATELGHKIKASIREKDILLLKGSRGSRMENLLQVLEASHAP
ncbi:MAG: UDP-N-acetylmuramoyl-tripeptide--D-alanyl-D-alanine ligase [Myxococcota bacterium]|nr:UDP-N-acetylmuramoyl-tripeptide--D-alanyl-D-alanine ligase [Myxococcota bacterium]